MKILTLILLIATTRRIGSCIPWPVHDLWQQLSQTDLHRGCCLLPCPHPTESHQLLPLPDHQAWQWVWLAGHPLLSFHGYSQAQQCFMENEEVALVFLIPALYWLRRKAVGYSGKASILSAKMFLNLVECWE